MANLTHLSICVRPYDKETDKNIILSSWAHQVREVEPLKNLTREVFREHMQKCLRALDENIVLTASNSEHKEQIYGWCCGAKRGSASVLHFIYVRKTWRQQGIATTLLKILCPQVGEEIIYFTHQSRGAERLKKKWKLVYNPYLFEEKQ
jgi:GNAT superfamily N-acetyltransferase